MRYLVDTNIISALAPRRPDRSAALVDWMDRASSVIGLSVITVAEVHDGIAKAAREGATRKAGELRQWWNVVEHLYGGRILTLDIVGARIAGELSDKARSAGFAPGFADIVIAAIAKRYGLVLLTRNARHFQPLGIALANPLEDLPPL